MKLLTTTALVAVVALALAYVAWPPDRSNSRDTPLPAPTSLKAATRAGPAASGNERRSTDKPDTRAQSNSRNCTIVTRYLPNEDGTVTDVLSCAPVAPVAEHPYESYSNEALESLAYADAKAAEILGMRLRERDEAAALSLILRASALSGGDVRPIVGYSNAYPHPAAIDGRPVRKTVRVKFVLSTVAELLGAESNNLDHWEQQIRRASTEPDQEIALLYERARRIVAEMQRIELEVTGSSTFGGQSDA